MSDAFERQRNLVAQHPRNELARFSLGRALFDAGRLDEAEVHLSVALELRPDWMVVQILLGKCALGAGRVEEARRCFERARDLAVAQHHEGPLEEMNQMLAELPSGDGEGGTRP